VLFQLAIHCPTLGIRLSTQSTHSSFSALQTQSAAAQQVEMEAQEDVEDESDVPLYQEAQEQAEDEANKKRGRGKQVEDDEDEENIPIGGRKKSKSIASGAFKPVGRGRKTASNKKRSS
jgi:hypothetical protein